jgi:hypothetical protein
MTEQQERALREGLRALAGRSREDVASPTVEAAVLARMVSHNPGAVAARRTSAPSTRWFSLAAAAVLMAASVAGSWLASRAEPRSGAVIRPAGFVEIPGASALPPIESGSIIRLALPVGALPQYGLPVPGDVISGHVNAELLVAQDGVPRAIRLVRDETMRSSAP